MRNRINKDAFYKKKIPMVSLGFFSDIIPPVAHGPGVSNRNGYQVYFLGVKAAGV